MLKSTNCIMYARHVSAKCPMCCIIVIADMPMDDAVPDYNDLHTVIPEANLLVALW